MVKNGTAYTVEPQDLMHTVQLGHNRQLGSVRLQPFSQRKRLQLPKPYGKEGADGMKSHGLASKNRRPVQQLFTNVGGLLVAVMFVIVIAAVLARYVFHVSMGGYDEFNYYFMTLTVWVGAVVASRQFENGHIKIDILDIVVKDKRTLAGFSVFWQIVAIATMAYFTKLSWEYTVYMKTINMMMAGLRFPMWVFVAAMTVCSFFMFVYEIAHLFFVIFKKLRAPRQSSREGG